MQTAAIVGAAAQVKKEGIEVNPEIMIPLIGHVNELTAVKGDLERVAKETAEAEGVAVPYKFGTMIEIPRACLTAGEIAGEAEFFIIETTKVADDVWHEPRRRWPVPDALHRKADLQRRPDRVHRRERRWPLDANLRGRRQKGQPEHQAGHLRRTRRRPRQREVLQQAGLNLCFVFAQACARCETRGGASGH